MPAHCCRISPSQDLLAVRGESLGSDDSRAVVDLITQQLEFANVIVLNKTDRVDAEGLHAATALVKSLNPTARSSARSAVTCC